MFQIGDIVFYPEHGVGIIDYIEEKDINGERKSYYNFHLINNPMKVVLPLERVDYLHMRLISDETTIDFILKDVSTKFIKLTEVATYNYKDRRDRFIEKIKTGTIENCLEVVYVLTKLKDKHNLNSTEGQLLYKAKKIIIEEIAISKNLSKDEAGNLLECAIGL